MGRHKDDWTQWVFGRHDISDAWYSVILRFESPVQVTWLGLWAEKLKEYVPASGGASANCPAARCDQFQIHLGLMKMMLRSGTVYRRRLPAKNGRPRNGRSANPAEVGRSDFGPNVAKAPID
jgi:hypothetical protein